MAAPSPESSATPTASDAANPRAECYRCFKPQAYCVCASIRKVNNRTEIIVIQHPRERFHAIGTARFVELGLQRTKRLVSWFDPERPLACSPEALGLGPISAEESAQEVSPSSSLKNERVGLLYPREGAKLLGALSPEERPERLIVLDGTWHHAHTIYRANPWFQEIPHYVLKPEEPSRYRIRKEPKAEYVSTLEAIVQALQVLEPGLEGLDELLKAFDQMIDAQITRSQIGGGRRRKRKRTKQSRSIPRALLEDYSNLVVVNSECSVPYLSAQLYRKAGSTPLASGSSEDAPPIPQLLYWVAQRPATGEKFSTFVRPNYPITDEHLRHLRLDRAHFEGAPSIDEALDAWYAFLRPSDLVASWNHSIWRMFCDAEERAAERHANAAHGAQSQLEPRTRPDFVLLKGSYFNVRKNAPRGDLDQLLAFEGALSTPTGFPGRAGHRLGNVLSLVQILREIGLRSDSSGPEER